MNPSHTDDNVSLTRGYNMAFGVMSKKLFSLLSPDIYQTLLRNSIPKGKESDDAETRKFAIRGLSKSFKTCGLNSVPKEVLLEAIEVFYSALNDYQIDRRGDVGSWVREEGMLALLDVLVMLNSSGEIRAQVGADRPEFYERFVAALL